jgi:hypothetical protein
MHVVPKDVLRLLFSDDLLRSLPQFYERPKPYCTPTEREEFDRLQRKRQLARQIEEQIKRIKTKK